MKTAKNRLWSFPPKVEANFEVKKVCKRFAYKLAYFLLTFAYKPAYSPAYLQVIGRAQSLLTAPIGLILRLENIASPGASWSISKIDKQGHLI
ncbi:MAG: hypothetical protein HY865_25760 [Chloroflexi bacterium]|nr:hypothetical protein [Chloroflexota bacterium]